VVRNQCNWALAVVTSWALFAASAARAVDSTWTVLGGGVQNWQNNANWSPATGFPNSISSTANLSVGLASNLTVNLGGDVTAGGLSIGSTAGAVTTNIASGRLVFSNNDDADFDDDNDKDGTDLLIWQRNLGIGTTNATGDANGDMLVDAADLRAWKQLFAAGGAGRPVLTSVGVAGSTNTISAIVRSGVLVDATPTFRAETIDVVGTNSLTMSGGYEVVGDSNVLNNFLAAGATLTVTGVNTVDQSDGITPRTVFFNNSNTNEGRIRFSGLTGGGNFFIGNTGNSGLMSTIEVGANPGFTGDFTQNRSMLVLTSDQAFGMGEYHQGNPSQRLVFHFQSDNDERKISNVMGLAQWQTISGDNSLEWAGVVAQDNTRGWVNLLPAGKTFTLSGKQYAVSDTDLTRTYTFDGWGTTIVTGEVSGNRYDFATNTENNGEGSVVASYVKAGSGALYFNGPTSFTGTMTVNGGNLHWADYDVNVPIASITVNYGAVGVSTGTLNNFFFHAKISPTSTGGLMIDDSEAAATFDFTSGDLGSITGSGARISLTAPETGLTFTGSIVPDNNQYRLGGGAGALTLPNVQLTGANSLLVTNGGVVQLSGANMYAGTTSVLAKYTTSLTAQAAAVNGVANNNALNAVYGGTVLAAGNLQNGGVASSIGSSSSDAANLVIQGSTLRYTGAGASTNRLFTVGTGGATLESSGAGAVNFTDTGALAMDEAESRAATAATNANITELSSTADLIVGMPVSGVNIPANATIAAVTGPTTFTLSANGTAAGATTLAFGSVARTLTLGGTNAGDNTLRPNIVNGGAATSVAKTGAGKWILTGANTYTGTTTVSEGTLLVHGTSSGGGAVSVAAGATLGGTGSITGAVSVSGTLAPGGGIGTLAVTGGVTFVSGATVRFEIAGTGLGQFDELNLTGALAAGGALNIVLTGGFNPAAGNSFDILDFSSATGSFALQLPALGTGLAWNTATLLTNGTISVTAALATVPEPTGAALLLAAAAAFARRRRMKTTGSAGGLRCRATYNTRPANIRNP
jgi:autotransporter-associated beta strand protein